MARSSDSNALFHLFRDKTFQAREIRRVIKLSAIYLLVTTVMVGAFYHAMLGRLIDGMAPMLFVSEDSALLNEALPSMGSVLTQWMLVMLLVNVVLTTMLAIYITRKLGQPILAIRRALRDIGNGNLDVRLRSSDSKEFGEITTEFNLAVFSIRKQITAAKESMNKAQFLSEGDNPSGDASSLNIAMDDCRGALDFFQAHDDELSLQPVDTPEGMSGSHRAA